MESPEDKSKKIQYPELAEEIQRMAAIDQEMRQKNIIDPEYWDEEVDAQNTEKMKDVISQIGWPTISKVGRESSHNAWLLVQHSDHDLAFQKQCLDLMKSEPLGEVLGADIAKLEDRVMVKESGKQLYGTQFEYREGKYIPRPIKDVDTVDDRRKEMGLNTLEENIQRMYEKYDNPSKEKN